MTYRPVGFPMELFPHGKATGHDGTRLNDQFKVHHIAPKPSALQAIQSTMPYRLFAQKHPAMAVLSDYLSHGKHLRRIISQELPDGPPTEPFPPVH